MMKYSDGFYQHLVKKQQIPKGLELKEYSKELAMDYLSALRHQLNFAKPEVKESQFIVELNSDFVSKNVKEGLIEVVLYKEEYRIVAPDGDVVGYFIVLDDYVPYKPSEREFIRFRIRGELIDLIDKFGEPITYRIGTTFADLRWRMSVVDPFDRLAVQQHQRDFNIVYARNDRVNGLYVLVLENSYAKILYTFLIDDGGYLAETLFAGKKMCLIWNKTTQRYDLKESNSVLPYVSKAKA